MPRKLQTLDAGGSSSGSSRGGPGGSTSGGKGKGRVGSPPWDGALAVECMGEGGRDCLRQFFADTDFARRIVGQLDEDGYCVLPAVFSAAEVGAELDRAWGFVERVSPGVRRDDRSTWWPTGGPDPWPHAQRDMMQLHQAGWVFSELRQMFAERVFEPLYGTRLLHVSKDGFTFQRPTEKDLKRSPNDHFDQGGRWLGLHCIQGSVALTDQEENDGCFQVWPRSHRHREEILSAPARRGGKHMKEDFVILTGAERSHLQQTCGLAPRRVPVRRGDVVLWRSDVAHCGAPPVGRCETPRVVVYVCCLPAALTPEPIYELKRQAYERLETGCHYPTREEWFVAAEKHNKLAWRPYFRSPPELTRRQRELYGLDRYSSRDAVPAPRGVADVTPAQAEAALDKSTSVAAPAEEPRTKRWGRR